MALPFNTTAAGFFRKKIPFSAINGIHCLVVVSPQLRLDLKPSQSIRFISKLLGTVRMSQMSDSDYEARGVAAHQA